MKDVLICPHCARALLKEDRRYACEHGHSFDIARQGYVNLLCGKGGTHGDNALMVEARRRFLDKGYYSPLALALEAALRAHAPKGAVLLDIGCGEGYYTARARKALSNTGARVYAFDISKEALKGAAHRRAADTLFVAGAYQMPVADASVDIATLLFSPFCREEILRVLTPGGLFLMAYPGERHLYGLKAALYDTPYLNRPEDTAIEGFTLLEEHKICDEITLFSKEDIAALFMMTPYYYKTGKRDQEKLFALSSLKTEIAFHLVLYQKNYTT